MVKVGTEEWAKERLRDALDDLGNFESAPAPLASDLIMLGKDENWKLLRNKAGDHFKTFHELCWERVPLGLGCDPAILLKRLKLLLPDHKRFVAFLAKVEPAEVGPGQGARTDLQPRDNITKSDRGTDPSYLVRRLKRDHHDIAERLVRGEFRSVRQAAIAAGIIHVKTPLEQLRHWWKRASEAERREFSEALD